MSEMTQLPFFGVLRVTGDDRADFLHNQLSNDILHLDEYHAAYATYNTPQGRVIADILVIARADEIYLVMAADLLEKVAKRLRMFVLRSKVALQVAEDLSVAGILPDNEGSCTPLESPPLQLPAHTENGTTRVVLPHGGTLLLLAAAQQPAYDTTLENRWRRHEIACGYPHIAATTTETCVAQMLNQHLLGGVNFKKGCYPGQEIIARAQYRGQVRRGLASFHAAAVLPIGTKITDSEGAEAGIVLDSVADDAGSLSLCVVKHAAAEQALFAAENHLHLQKIFFHTKEEA